MSVLVLCGQKVNFEVPPHLLFHPDRPALEPPVADKKETNDMDEILEFFSMFKS